MPPTNDFLPFATIGGAHVISQADFLTAIGTWVGNGFTAGIADSSQLNKVWRQSSFVAASIAEFIVQQLGVNVLDDGDLATFTSNLTDAIIQAAHSGDVPVVVAYSATPVFDCSLGDRFEITLTGNVTSSTLTNLSPGQIVVIKVKQDSTGARSFVWPTNVVGGAVVDPTVSADTVQILYVASDSKAYGAGVSNLTSSLSTPGYYRFPNGLILQWGKTLVSSAGTHIAFPLTFPTACFVTMGSDMGAVGSNGSHSPGCAPNGNSEFVAYASAYPTTIGWIALGY